MQKEINLGKYTGYVTNSDPDMISVEYEIAYDPDHIQKRATWKWITTNKLVPEGIKPSVDVILNVLIPYFKEEFPLYEDFVLDGGGVEANIAPRCLTLYKNSGFQDNLKKFMETAKSLGFSDEKLTAGIHLNIDYDFLGENAKERALVIKKLCEFAFNNIDFMIRMSSRKRGAQILTDMNSFLGNTYGTEDPRIVFRSFSDHRDQIVKFFKDDNHKTSFNSVFNLWASKCGRRCLEVRWFGSTLNIEEFNSIVEFGFALIHFCKKSSNNNLLKENFIDFVLLEPSKYSNLTKRISSLYKLKNNAEHN